MHQVLPDLTSQVTAGPAADPAAFAIAEGTAGANPGAPAAAADEPQMPTIRHPSMSREPSTAPTIMPMRRESVEKGRDQSGFLQPSHTRLARRPQGR